MTQKEGTARTSKKSTLTAEQVIAQARDKAIAKMLLKLYGDPELVQKALDSETKSRGRKAGTSRSLPAIERIPHVVALTAERKKFAAFEYKVSNIKVYKEQDGKEFADFELEAYGEKAQVKHMPTLYGCKNVTGHATRFFERAALAKARSLLHKKSAKKTDDKAQESK